MSMRETLKRFLRLTIGYSPVTLLGPILTILLTPLYTRVLEPTDYGIVDVALTLFSLVTLIVLLSMDQAINAHFFDGDTTHQRNLVTTAVIYVLVSGIITGLIISSIATPLAQLLFHDKTLSHLIYLLTINMISGSIYGVINAALRLTMSVKHVNIIGITYILATVINHILFILVFRLQATGIILATTLTNLLAAIVSIILGRELLFGKFSTILFKELSKSGIGLLPGSLSTLVLMSADRLLLTQFVAPSDIGLYSIANKLASMLYVLTNGAWSAWWPIALEMAKEPEAPQQYGRMFEYFIAGSMWLSLTIGIAAADILAVFTRTLYVPAAPYALILLIYFGPISTMFSSFQIGLYIRKRTDLISGLIFIGAIANIILNLIMLPMTGVWGAVWATVMAGMIIVVTAYFVTQHIFPIPYNFLHLSTLTITYLGLVIGNLLIPPALNTMLLKIITIGIFTISVPFTGVITYSQLKSIGNSLKNYLQQLLYVKNNP